MHFVNFLGCVGLFASSVFAQCFTFGGQQPSPALNLAPGSEVYDLEVVDRDGTGPQQPVLMIGGMAGGYQWSGSTLTTITSSPVRQFASNTSGTLYVLREDNLVEIRPATLPASVLGGFTGQINSITVANGILWSGGRVIGSNGFTTPVLMRLTAGRWQDATPASLVGSIFTVHDYGGRPMMGGSLAYPRHPQFGGGYWSGPMLLNGNAWQSSALPIVTLIAVGSVDPGYTTASVFSDGSNVTSENGNGVLSYTDSTITALQNTMSGVLMGTDTGRVLRVFVSSFNSQVSTQPTGILANGPIYAIESFQNDLYIAGGFTEVNGQPAIGVARLLNTGAPQFTQQPSNQQVFATETLTLAAPVANPTDVTFQWSFNGTPIGNGLTQGSQLVSGANTSVLSIQRPRVTMSGIYTLRATNSCGTTTSSPVEVTVVPACDSVDFNNDGIFPDDQDVVAFFRVLAGGQCFE
jgi:hypothetical protein